MSKKFTVRIEETLAKIIDVEADSKEEACRFVKELYDLEDIVLHAEDFVDCEITILED